MSGSLTVPNTFATQSGNVPVSQIDTNFTTVQNYVNNREITVGVLGSRPAAGTSGRYYFATDANGGTLYVDTGSTWQQIAASLTQAAQPNVLVGLTLSNDGGSPNTTLDIAAGATSSDDATLGNRVQMTLSSAMTGTTGGTWVVGSGQPKLDAGAVAASTWYHVHVIERTDTQVVDVLFSKEAVSPALPASYTKKRRIGSFKTNASSQIIAFIQQGDYFRLSATVLDWSFTNLGTSASTATLASCCSGVNVQWVGSVLLHINAVPSTVLVSDLAASDEAPTAVAAAAPAAPGYTTYSASTGVAQLGGSMPPVRTNTAGQVRVRLSASDANTILGLVTWGWWDRRGQDS